MRKTAVTILLFACGFCIGLFLSVRLNALFISAWNIRFPLWSLLAAACLLGITPAVFNQRLTGYLKTQAHFKLLSACVIGFASVVFCLVFRNRVTDEALAASGISIGCWAIAVMIGASLVLTLFLLYIWSAVKSSFPFIRQWLKSLDKRDFIFIAALIVLLNLLAWLYISRSSRIYYWDNAGYWHITQTLAETAHQGIVSLLKFVYESILTLDYNYLIALPWTPLVLLFGSSRWVFVCGIVNFGLVPLFVLIYAYVRSTCRRKIAASMCLIASFPMLIYTAFVGYIDIVGVFFILSAMLLWKSDKNNNDIGRFMIVGVLLAVSILLRRWYSFFALSFVITLVVDSVFFRKSVIPVLGTLCSLGFSLFFLFQPFVSNIVLKNYSQLYSAYKMGMPFDAAMFFNYFGIWTTLVAVLTGIYFCSKREKRQTAIFLLVQMMSCFVIFTCVQSHNQQHLLLYVPSLVLLMSMLIAPLADALTKRKAAGVLLAGSALLPLVTTVLPVFSPKKAERTMVVSLLPNFTFKPYVWSDAEEIVKIIRYLDEAVGGSGKTVGILASSFTLNSEILLNAEASLNLKRISDVSRSYLITLPAVDSRDPFPGALLTCDYLLVADPVQLHLGEEKQQVVYLPAKQLLGQTGIGAAFEQVGETFYMNNGKVRIALYEKQRALTDAEKNDLMNEFNADTQR